MTRRTDIRTRSARWPLAVLLGAILSLSASAADAAKVGTKYDRDADFDGLETYAWRSKENVPADSPLAEGGKVDTLIREIVSEELARRGFRAAEDGESPD